MQILATCRASTMHYQIDFGKARLGLIPLGKGANRDSALEECARLGGSQSMRFSTLALGLQQVMGCRWTQGEQALFGLRLQVQFPILFEHPHQLRQIRDQALATNAIGGSPAGHQPLLHRKGILTRARPFLAGRGLGDRVIEQAEAHTCHGSRYWRRTPPGYACAPLLGPLGTVERPPPTPLPGLYHSP